MRKHDLAAEIKLGTLYARAMCGLELLRRRIETADDEDLLFFLRHHYFPEDQRAAGPAVKR